MKLRDVEPGDFEALFKMQADAESCRMAAFPARSKEAFRASLDKALADPGCHYFVIVVEGEVAGFVCSWIAGSRRMVGYWVARESWGQGHATEALRLFLEAVPERPIHAIVVESNARSRRVLEKSGFEFVGQEEMLDTEFGPLVELFFQKS